MVYEIRKPPKIFRIAAGFCALVLLFEIMRYGSEIFGEGILSFLGCLVLLAICLNGCFKDYTLTIDSGYISIRSNYLILARLERFRIDKVKRVLVGSDNNDSETCSSIHFVLDGGQEVAFGPYCSQKSEMLKYQSEIVKILGIDNLFKE